MPDADLTRANRPRPSPAKRGERDRPPSLSAQFRAAGADPSLASGAPA